MAQKVSKTRQNAYATYKTAQRWKTNREAKLRKQIKLQPNNLQLVAALKNISYRRHTPKSEFWSHGMKATAQLIKQFCGSCPHSVFNSNPIVAANALKALGKTGETIKPDRNSAKAVSFSIEARAKVSTI